MPSMTDFVVETGQYRARIVPDSDREKPDWDGQGWVFSFDRRTNRIDTQHAETDDHGKVWDFGLVEAIGRFNDEALIFRYLRMWHDVVSFDTLDLNGWELYFVVTREQADRWGWDDPEWAKLAGQARETWRAYIEGDVYGYIVEEQVPWMRLGPDGKVNPSTIDVRHTWEHVDSCYGFYGYDYAVSEASATVDHLATPARAA